MYHLEERDKQNKRDNQDEIELGVIFDYIGRLFRKIGDGIQYVLMSIRHSLAIVIIFIMLGMAIAFAVYNFTKPFYTSSMTLVLANIRNEFVENHLTNLSDMINEGNVIAVSEQLGIRPEAAKEIKQMMFVNLDQDRVNEDSILTGSPFRIELTLYNNDFFESMEPAITSYLENNRYFSKQKRIRQREIESLIAKLKNQVESIDSIKTTVSSPRGPVNGFVYGEPIDPTNLYRESMSLYEQQVKLEAELDKLDNIQVVNGFTPRALPTGPNLSYFLKVGALIALVASVIVSLVLESRRNNRASL